MGANRISSLETQITLQAPKRPALVKRLHLLLVNQRCDFRKKSLQVLNKTLKVQLQQLMENQKESIDLPDEAWSAVLEQVSLTRAKIVALQQEEATQYQQQDLERRQQEQEQEQEKLQLQQLKLPPQEEEEEKGEATVEKEDQDEEE